MTNTHTVGELLQDGRQRLREAGIDDAPLEAEALLRHAMGLGGDRAHLLAALRDEAPEGTRSAYADLLERRIAREPLAYITGSREFYGLDFACSPAALVPRPETELLVEMALDWMRAVKIERPLAIDAGTGSGALAVAIAANAPSARIIATDVSLDALRLARGNAEYHDVRTRLELVRCHLLAPLRSRADVILANLPYVSERDWSELPDEIRRHEPRGALVGGERGTEIIEEMLAQAPRAMAPRSLLVCEHGDTQGAVLRAAAGRAMPYARISTVQDLAGLDRVLRVECG